MTDFSVVAPFIHMPKEYRAGETFTVEQLAERGMDAKAIEHWRGRGCLALAEPEAPAAEAPNSPGPEPDGD